MSSYSDLVKLIKQAAVEAVEANNPVSLCYGNVTSASPLKILVDQKMTLTKAQLVLTETVHSKLVKGDSVLLIREQGGQKYIVIDRMVN